MPPHPFPIAGDTTALPASAGCALSVVTMVYRSLPFLPEFLRQTREAVAQAGIDDYEIVFVNDGSPDASMEYLLAERRLDPRVRIVDLARNFGHHKAALAGLSHARGALVFMIDCDLEVPPAILSRMLAARDDTGADVVYGMQEQRKGGWLQRHGGGLFWRLFNRLSDTKVPANVLTERLMTQAYVRALLSLGDRNVFMAGMMYWTGFHQVGITIEKGTREGASTYSFGKRLALLVEAITSFSTVPLKLVLATGVLLTLASMALAVGILVQKLLQPASVLAGFTTISLLVIGMGGVTITLMGVLGLYISRIFVQTQGRPTFIVRQFHGSETANERKP